MKRIMVDIETLGVNNDTVVLSIAAIPFELPEGNGLPQFGPARMWYPSLREQFAAGRTVSEGTLEWWQRDDLAQARANWAYLRGVSIEESVDSCYHGFISLVESYDEVWAHGVVFDIGIIESLFARVGPKPWKNYGVIRDVRTLVRALPELRQRPDWSKVDDLPVVEHDPVSDCVDQIWNLWKVWPEEKLDARPDYNTTAIGH